MKEPDIVTRLRGLWKENDCTSTLMDQAADEIERLRSERDEARRTVTERRRERDEARGERDEARRMYCKLVARNEPEYIAERWGWDCFKENTDD